MKDNAWPSIGEMGAVDVELFARNLARMIEEGGKALAAYMRPREEGDIQARSLRRDHRRGQDVSARSRNTGWPIRSAPSRCSRKLGKAYLDLWGTAVKRLAGQSTRAGRHARPEGQALRRPGVDDQPVLRFPEAGLSADARIGPSELVAGRQGPRPAYHAEGRVLHPPDRQRALAVELRSDQSRNCCARRLRPTPTISSRGMHNPRRGHRGRRRQPENPAVGRGFKFEVGRNLAMTPGKVIFQNELIQLIQYHASTTEKVLKRPLLIVPPWINKFYVLDLTPEKSFIKWCVDQGLTVFVISWVNPDARHAKKNFDDYMRDGPLAAIDAIETSRPARSKVHALGYCVGGTLLAMTLAYLAAKSDKRARSSATLLCGPGRFHPCRRPQGVRRRGTDRDARAAHGRARLSRRLRNGDSVQHAALERPDLALCHQQLPARQGADAVRSAVLEFGCDPHAGGQSLVLSAQLLSQQHADQGQDGRSPASSSISKRSRCRSTISPRARTISRRRSRCSSARHFFGGPVRFVLVGLRPHRRRRQSAGQDQISILDRRQGRRGHNLDSGSRSQEHPGSWWPDWLAWIKAEDSAKVDGAQPGEAASASRSRHAPGSYVKVTSYRKGGS